MRYDYRDNTQLSAHFNVQEFRCKCGREHDILINPELIVNLEKLYSSLNCSKIIVTSGYRCEAHDRSVGGTGKGQHTVGNAADICCYGQDGQPVSSRKVCCNAQDIGFGGIANITDEYIYTHVDVRTGKRWYGDEVISNNDVTDDFHKYYGGSCDMKGIDVSVHNGAIDWQRVKNAGVEFAIIRAGFGKFASQKDENFEVNYNGAKAAGIPAGAYWYSYATTVAEAVQEANVFVSVLAGKQFEFPVFFDMEEQAAFETGKVNCSAMVRAFCDVLEQNGYWVGLYTSRSYLEAFIEDDIKKRYALWIAEWGSRLNYSGSVGIWQCSEKGYVDGIGGNVDLDVAYVDYPSEVRESGLNGYGKTEQFPAAEVQIEPFYSESPEIQTNETNTVINYQTELQEPANETTAEVTITIGNDTYKGTLYKE